MTVEFFQDFEIIRVIFASCTDQHPRWFPKDICKLIKNHINPPSMIPVYSFPGSEQTTGPVVLEREPENKVNKNVSVAIWQRTELARNLHD